MTRIGMLCCTLGAASALMGVHPFVPTSAQAMNLTAAIAFKAATRETEVTRKVPYTCRQGPNGRECYYTSSSDRSRSESQPSNNGNPYFQRRYTGPSQYQAHPWGAPYGQD
jgi:hypothetical protein